MPCFGKQREGTDRAEDEGTGYLESSRPARTLAGLVWRWLHRLRGGALVPSIVLADLGQMMYIPLLEFSRNALTEHFDRIIMQTTYLKTKAES